MANKVFKRWARSWELRKVATVCPLCSAGCRMEMNVKESRVFRITTDIETHNKGTLCVGGRFGYDLIHSEDRLLSPMVRDAGESNEGATVDATARSVPEAPIKRQISSPVG